MIRPSKLAYLRQVARDWLAHPGPLTPEQETCLRELLTCLLDRP